MGPQERIEIIVNELVRLRYGFELNDNEYRQAKMDIAIESVKDCAELIEWYEKDDEWPDEETLSDLDWYEDRIEEE